MGDPGDTAEPDYDDPEVEARWCDGQRDVVTRYLRAQRLEHGRIGESPAWHMVPYVAVWAVESVARPGWVGWWAISGDLPTDYVSAADVSPRTPRAALRVFAENWLALVTAWREGRDVENTTLGDPDSRAELAPLLESRARLLLELADDDSVWGGQ